MCMWVYTYMYVCVYIYLSIFVINELFYFLKCYLLGRSYYTFDYSHAYSIEAFGPTIFKFSLCHKISHSLSLT